MPAARLSLHVLRLLLRPLLLRALRLHFLRLRRSGARIDTKCVESRAKLAVCAQELAMAIAQRHVAHACLGTPAHDLGDAKKAELVLLRARWEARGSGAGELCCAGTGALTPMTMPTCCGSWFSGRLVAGHSGFNSHTSQFQHSSAAFTMSCSACTQRRRTVFVRRMCGRGHV